jgi:predicted flap endonuclease-1-like 5' DNA nuclease
MVRSTAVEHTSVDHNEHSRRDKNVSDWWPWILLIVVLVILAVVIWWWWKRRSEQVADVSQTRKPAPPAAAPVVEAKPAAPAAPVVPVAADNLEIIEGIGPKIAGVLNSAGIKTFAQLAATDVTKLQGILTAAGLRLADPGTWAEQAGLAAAGKMDELQKLQDALKGGRRT